MIRKIIDNESVYLRLIEVFSTQIIYIKKNKTDFKNCPIYQQMMTVIRDKEKLNRIHFVFQGDKIIFPNYKVVECRVNIIKDYISGKSYNEIAIDRDRTVDSVRKTIKKYLCKK